MVRRLAQMTLPLYVVVFVLVLLVIGDVYVLRYARLSGNPGVFLSHGSSEGEEFAYGSWPALSNGDFFKSVHAKLLEDKNDFIEANLVEKKLTVYKNGLAKLTVPILAVGKAGSWWETPAGLYKIAGKEKNHFSAFSGVNMPWSLPFQGNFFIHGWPYYPDGTPVSTSYSGGCIRLSTADAELVYNLADVSMPVLVYRIQGGDDQTRYAVKAPLVSASEYLVADIGSNFVLAEHGSKDQVPIASITKLITALVATEYINLDKTLTITKSMIVTTSKPRLWAGQQVRAFDLMYPLLLESSNEVAEVFAQTLGRERFIGLMNEKARALGLSNTHFIDPAGFDAGNVSTAEDLFSLLKYLYTNQSFFLKISTGRKNPDLGTSPVFVGLENFNGFGGNPEFFGGKIGRSGAAQDTMASIFEVENLLKRPVAIIVLGSQNSIEDTATLLNYVRDTYSPQE